MSQHRSLVRTLPVQGFTSLISAARFSISQTHPKEQPTCDAREGEIQRQPASFLLFYSLAGERKRQAIGVIAALLIDHYAARYAAWMGRDSEPSDQ
jgi:hypothetical protein